jgi:hypothetical protein
MRLPKNSVSKPIRRGQVLLNLRSGKEYVCVSSVHRPCHTCDGTGKRWVLTFKNPTLVGTFKTTLEHVSRGNYELITKLPPVVKKRMVPPHTKRGVNREAVRKRQRKAAQESEAKDDTMRGNTLTVHRSTNLGGSRRSHP